MGIVESIDRLLQTLRTMPGPTTSVRDPLSGLPLTASEQAPPEDTNGRPSAPPPSEKESDVPAGTAPASRVSEDSPTEQPAPAAEEGLNGSRAREPHVAAEDTLPTPGEPPDSTGNPTEDAPATAPEHALAEGPADAGELDTSGGEPPEAVAPSLQTAPDGPETTPTADTPAPGMPDRLHADSLARLEVAAGAAESLGLGFHLGGAVERIAFGASRGREGTEALREAGWLIERYIALVEGRPVGADLHASAVRLGRAGDAIAELRALTEALDRLPPDPALSAPALTLTPEPAAPGPSASEPTILDADALPVDAASPGKASPSALHQPPEPEDSFGREVALMAIRWAIMVIAVVVVVLAVTLIGEWL